MKKGFYLVFEGIVGTGKTTQSKKLYEFLRPKFPQRPVLWTHEPGGGEVANAIRKVVQATKFEEEMDPVCEAYLYAASRAQTLRTVVKPILNQNGLVVSDRSFITSLAYQGHARGVGLERILTINQSALGNALPDLVLFLKLDPKIGAQRTFDKEGDRWESRDLTFFEEVQKGYQKISRLPLFKDKWMNIDARGNISEVFDKILKKILKHIICL